LADIASIMRSQPQVLVNVSVADKACMEHDAVQELIAHTQERLGAHGRILVRASGTEPLIRVMIEGQDEREIRELAQKVAEGIRQAASPS